MLAVYTFLLLMNVLGAKSNIRWICFQAFVYVFKILVYSYSMTYLPVYLFSNKNPSIVCLYMIAKRNGEIINI